MNRTRNFVKIFRAGIIAFAILLVSGGFADAQEKTTKAADEVFADLSMPGSPGCALAVARGGKIVCKKGDGFRNIEEAVPLTPQAGLDVGWGLGTFTAPVFFVRGKHGRGHLSEGGRQYIA